MYEYQSTNFPPSHLINLRESGSVPSSKEEEYDAAAYGPKRWMRMNFLKERFWQEWNKFYLFERPYIRTKWWKKQDNARVGDIVLMRDKNRPRLDWNEGVITEVTVDPDGLVRKVWVRPIKRDDKSTTSQTRERAIHDLVLLQRPVDGKESEIELEPDEPPNPPSCNNLAICPFCDLDITTGGLNRCCYIHQSLDPIKYDKIKNKQALKRSKTKLNHRIESDKEAIRRITNLIKRCPASVEADEEEIDTSPLLTVLKSGVTILGMDLMNKLPS